MTAYDLKIEHGTVITMDGQRRILKDGAVAIRGDRIVAVDKTAALADQPAERTVDATGRVVLPGLVSAHCHNVQALARGLGDDVPVELWTYGRIYPYETRLTEEDAYWSTLLNCAEMIRTGTTCHADPGGYVMDGVGQALTECGLRGIITWAGMDDFPKGYAPPLDFPGCKTTEETLAASERLVKRWHKSANDRVRVSYGLRVEPNVSDELFQGVKACADRDATIVQFHCLLRGLSDVVRERTGMSTVQWMAGLGVLGPNWLLAHMSDASDSDVVIVKMHDAKVAHNPGASMHSTYGAASRGKVPEMLERGVTVGLGCDSAAANNSLDMFRAMYQVATVHKEVRLQPDLIRPEKALEMATIDGARALGWDAEVGSLEPGKRADLIVVNARRANWVPMHDFSIVANLVYAGEGADVEMTMVDGRIVMESGRLTTIDVDRVLVEAQRIAERIIRTLPYQGSLRPRWPVV
ncbi:MAG: amidohydrolase [Candidatus Rokuibacteriota bacterium]